MQKFKFYFVSLVALATFINVVVPILPKEILPDVLETKKAQAASDGPSFSVTVGDIGCSEQHRTSNTVGFPGGSARATDGNQKDIDCAKINFNPGNTSAVTNQSIYNYDFQLGVSVAESPDGSNACNQQEGQIAYTPWASEGTAGGTNLESGNGTGSTVAADCVNVYLNFRELPEGRIIENVRLGIQVGNAGMQYTNDALSGGGSSAYSTSGDFTTARVGIWSQSKTVVDDADYISTTIPQVATAQYPTGNPSGSTMGTLPLNSAQSYNIVMKNLGGPWVSDLPPISRTIVSAEPSPTGSNCDSWQPTASGQTCIEDRVLASSKYKLKRIDGVSSIQTNSSEFEYRRTVRYTYSSYEIVFYECVPDEFRGGLGGGDDEKLNKADDYRSPLDLLFKTAHALDDFPGEPTCTWTEIPTGEYAASPPSVSPIKDIIYNDNATFPFTLTATAAGDFQLRFQMVRTSNGNQFGEIAEINVRAGNPWSFTCGVNQTVTLGSNANYVISAAVPGGYSNSINVTMGSNPAGPALQTSPVVLDSVSKPPYTRTAVVPTGSLTPQTYTLTFYANDGSVTTTCQSTLTVTAPQATVNLRFNNVEGPTTIVPGTGTLTWDSANAAACTGSMQQGADTSSPAWSGSRATANSGNTQSFNVSGLAFDTTYTFRIICTNQFGQPSLPDTVQVTRLPQPPNPTADIKCMGDGDKDPQDGPCNIIAGASAVLTWESTNATGCTIDPHFGAVATSEPDGQTTPNLNNETTYTLDCEGADGTTNATDTVTIITSVVVEPPNQPTVSVSNTSCGVIRITVTPGAVPPTVDGWMVGWGTSQGDIPNALGGYPTPIPAEYTQADPPQPLPLVFYHGTSSTPPAGVPTSRYAYSPAPVSIGNFYKVAAVNSSTPDQGSNPNNWSGVTTDTGINLVTCRPDLSLSDKDIIAVGTATNPTSIYNVPGNPCSGTHEVIPNNRIFKNGEVVTYKINACNSGSENLTRINITDTMENLVYVPNSMSASPAGCASLTSQDGANINFNLNDIPAPASPSSPTVCSITFRATITAPAGSPSALYRFRNTAILNTNQGVEYLRTPYYLFSLGAGVPDRNETSPQ